MTSEEKKQITQLRKRGCTYQEISQETGLALSTVKTHLQRMKPVPNSSSIRSNGRSFFYFSFVKIGFRLPVESEG